MSDKNEESILYLLCVLDDNEIIVISDYLQRTHVMFISLKIRNYNCIKTKQRRRDRSNATVTAKSFLFLDFFSIDQSESF